MDSAAQAEAPTYIKQEYDDSGSSSETQQADRVPSPPSKRRREDAGADGDNEAPHGAKRKKIELTDEEKIFQEKLFEETMQILVHNAITNMSGLPDSYDEPASALEHRSESADANATMSPEVPCPPASWAVDPTFYARRWNLYTLANQALTILMVYLQPPLSQTIKLIKDTESEHGRMYKHQTQAFTYTRILYSIEPVLSLLDLAMADSESQTLVELANLAQLGIWLVDGSASALSDAVENFLVILNCQVSDLSQEATELYLKIMTQRAIVSLLERKPEKPSDVFLGEVFMMGLEERLREQNGGDELTSADQTSQNCDRRRPDFISSVQARKETLQGEAKEQSEPMALGRNYPLQDLLRLYVAYVRGRLKASPEVGDKYGVSLDIGLDELSEEESGEKEGSNADLDDLAGFFEDTASRLAQNAMSGLGEEPETPGDKMDADIKMDGSPTQGGIDLMTDVDFRELEALVAESTSNYVRTTLSGLSPVPYQPTVPPSTTESMVAQNLYMQHGQQTPAHPGFYANYPTVAGDRGDTDDLPPNQSCSSADLYDKARQAALSKSSAHTRREGSHSTRRPWTQEEEKALMTGLDIVKGPHWSQILQLFGPQGTMSDILRDRTQVQLKDKARNLKLFFLKTNSEMPYYLQAVTGELKTRAPTQAARKEAEERARLNSDEEAARLVAASMAVKNLGGGYGQQLHQQQHQNHHQQNQLADGDGSQAMQTKMNGGQAEASTMHPQSHQNQGQSQGQVVGQVPQSPGQASPAQGQAPQAPGQAPPAPGQAPQAPGQAPQQPWSQTSTTASSGPFTPQMQRPTHSLRPAGSPAPAPMTAPPAQRPAGIPVLASASQGQRPPQASSKPSPSSSTPGPQLQRLATKSPAAAAVVAAQQAQKPGSAGSAAGAGGVGGAGPTGGAGTVGATAAPATAGGQAAGSRPAVQPTTQQVLQSMPQAPPRPQTQLPPAGIQDGARRPTQAGGVGARPSQQGGQQQAARPLTGNSTTAMTANATTAGGAGSGGAAPVGSLATMGRGGNGAGAGAAYAQMKRTTPQTQPGQAFVQAYRPQAQVSRVMQTALTHGSRLHQAAQPQQDQKTVGQQPLPQSFQGQQRQQQEAATHNNSVEAPQVRLARLTTGMGQTLAQMRANAAEHANPPAAAGTQQPQRSPSAPTTSTWQAAGMRLREQQQRQQGQQATKAAPAPSAQVEAAKSTSAATGSAGVADPKPPPSSAAATTTTTNGGLPNGDVSTTPAQPSPMSQRQEPAQSDKAAEATLVEGLQPAVAPSLA